MLREHSAATLLRHTRGQPLVLRHLAYMVFAKPSCMWQSSREWGRMPGFYLISELLLSFRNETLELLPGWNKPSCLGISEVAECLASPWQPIFLGAMFCRVGCCASECLPSACDWHAQEVDVFIQASRANSRAFSAGRVARWQKGPLAIANQRVLIQGVLGEGGLKGWEYLFSLQRCSLFSCAP